MAMMFLAIAVFGWGLNYKLSLYRQPSGHVSAFPHAKLLSQKERPAFVSVESTDRSTSFQPQSSIFSSALKLSAILLGLYVASVVRMQAEIVNGKLLYKYANASNYFSFRPPPSLS